MTAEPIARERSYTWTDPAETAAATRDVDGLTFLRSLAAGAIPAAPIATTLGMTLEEVEEGRVVFGARARGIPLQPDRLGARRRLRHAARLGLRLRGALGATGRARATRASTSA